jgi:hypothetical protein
MKLPYKISALAASIALAGALAAPAQATPVLIGGDFSISTPSPSTNQGARPMGLAGWSAVTSGAANWTGIDFISGTPTGAFTANNGTVTTFGIVSPVTLVDLDFTALPANLVLGNGSGAYTGYTMTFQVQSVTNKFKSGNIYGVDMYGVLSFDDGNNATNDFTDTNWLLSFSCAGCTTANQSNQTWSINGSAIIPVPGTLALLGVGLLGASGLIRRSRREAA